MSENSSRGKNLNISQISQLRRKWKWWAFLPSHFNLVILAHSCWKYFTYSILLRNYNIDRHPDVKWRKFVKAVTLREPSFHLPFFARNLLVKSYHNKIRGLFFYHTKITTWFFIYIIVRQRLKRNCSLFLDQLKRCNLLSRKIPNLQSVYVFK